MLPLLVGALLASNASADVAAQMRSLGVGVEDLVVPFAADAPLSSFAKRAVSGATGEAEPALRLFAALRELKDQKAIIGDHDNVPKKRKPKTAIELFRVAQSDADPAQRRAGCYELSVLFVAAARAVGLDAVGVERARRDGTGQIGHIMAAVDTGGGNQKVFDLQNERWRPTSAGVRELSDLELAAHHYNHHAVAQFFAGNLDEALRQVDIALRLAPDEASFLNNRATILFAKGEPVIALAEVTHAVRRAPHIPLYRYQLGRLRLAVGDIESALKAFEHALSLRPSYGLALRDRARALWQAGRLSAAREQLMRLLADHPDTPRGHLYAALFLAENGEVQAALDVISDGKSLEEGRAELAALEKLLRSSRDEQVVRRQLHDLVLSLHRAPEATATGGEALAR